MSAVQTKKDVVYDKTLDLKTDIYYPETGTAKGGIIDIHGGGWFRGDKAKDSDWAEALVGQGYFVVVPNYRFTPQAYYPAPLADMDTLYQWLKASDYDFDHAHIAAVGSSAGGNMTVELAIKYGIPIVSLSGILDIDQWLATHQDVVAAEGQTADFNSKASAEINQDGANDAFYKWFVTNYFNGRTDQYEAATPYHRVTDQTGPMYLANSLNEFVPTSGVLQLAQTLTAHNIPFTARMLTGSRHAKGYLGDVLDDTMNFLAQHI
ncbi:hypothetical protein FC83_GL001642 [Agrilactobacillus composti DSM 18527 = JCM 14202]|uniref:BD-FAE-like domain-containing protein n=1 Tax=Agrilactobacillus composti DSM 18527 = JCM 14202 TaxID=1423734 RepID=A0A0R1XUX6_9LACO|nr:alpha/beta hydrolase [Agrilactobacillus composti]KRM30508.1 hypothetical protein FC83_GL001642 [Agrilactobacillus composti DSM 18527 = JCM 14202]